MVALPISRPHLPIPVYGRRGIQWLILCPGRGGVKDRTTCGALPGLLDRGCLRPGARRRSRPGAVGVGRGRLGREPVPQGPGGASARGGGGLPRARRQSPVLGLDVEVRVVVVPGAPLPGTYQPIPVYGRGVGGHRPWQLAALRDQSDGWLLTRPRLRTSSRRAGQSVLWHSRVVVLLAGAGMRWVAGRSAPRP